MSIIQAALEVAVARASASGDKRPVVDLMVPALARNSSVAAGETKVCFKRGGVVKSTRYAETVGDLLHRLVEQDKTEELDAAMKVVASALLSRGYSRQSVKDAGKKAVWFVKNQRGLAAPLSLKGELSSKQLALQARAKRELEGVARWEGAFGPLTARDFLLSLQGPPALLRAFEEALAWKGTTPQASTPAPKRVRAPKAKVSGKARTDARLAKAKAKKNTSLDKLQAQVEEAKASARASSTQPRDSVVVYERQERAQITPEQVEARKAEFAKRAKSWAQDEVAKLAPRLEAQLGDDKFVAELSELSARFSSVVDENSARRLVGRIRAALEAAEAR